MSTGGGGLKFDPIAEAKRQWAVHDWAEPDAMAAITSVIRVQQIVIGRAERALRAHQLTFARYEALVLLHFSSRGSLPLGKIGERLQVHPASVTNTIDRLEDQGLARRIANPADRRGILAEITPKGRELVQRATKTITTEAFTGLGLTRRQANELVDLLRLVRRHAGDFEEETRGARAKRLANG